MKNIIFDKQIYILENCKGQKIAVTMYPLLSDDMYSCSKHQTDLYTTIKSLEDLHEFMKDIDFDLKEFQKLRDIIAFNTKTVIPIDLMTISKYEDYIKDLNYLKKRLNQLENAELDEI